LSRRERRERPAFPAKILGREMTQPERARVDSAVRTLLHWQRSLGRWPGRPSAVPDATAFISIYAQGQLRGCFGCNEGSPGERLVRAFLRAIEDVRYGLVSPEERDELVAVVSYVGSARTIDADRVDEEMEPGLDGLALVIPDREPAVLLPQVARDGQLDARSLLATLIKKSGTTAIAGATLFAFTTEDVIARPQRFAPESNDELDLAARWLATLVSPSGRVAFGIDAHARKTHATGPMHHARAAVLLRALDAHAGHRRVASRVRTWLSREVAAGARGAPVAGWPRDVGEIAGTYALASMAGIDVGRELLAIARSDALRASPWHAAQVVAALGMLAPEPLWRSCVDHLNTQPWAPWTAIAARVRGEGAVLNRARRVLTQSIRLRPPAAGGCSATAVPETALTALVVEALAPDSEGSERKANRLAVEFLRSLQFTRERAPGPIDPDLAAGAFPASRIVDFLRGDVTAHALLALTAPQRSG
jgi:AMMECR1 domain-containing protein